MYTVAKLGGTLARTAYLDRFTCIFVNIKYKCILLHNFEIGPYIPTKTDRWLSGYLVPQKTHRNLKIQMFGRRKL